MDLRHLTPEQRALAEMMSDISDDHYSAVWVHGLEHHLWAALLGKLTSYGMRDLDPAALEELRQASERVDGWVVWSGQEPAFMPLEQWLEEYQEGLRRRRDPEAAPHTP